MKKSLLWLISLTCLIVCHAAAQTLVEEAVVNSIKTGDSGDDPIAVVNSDTRGYDSPALDAGDAQPSKVNVFACRIYPNPANEKVIFKLQVPWPGKVEIRLVIPDGRITDQLSAYVAEDDENVSIDLSRLPTGVYIYEVYFMGKRKSGRIVHL